MPALAPPCTGAHCIHLLKCWHGIGECLQELEDCEAKFRLATQQSAPEDALSQLSLGNGPAGRRPQKTSGYAHCIRAGVVASQWQVLHRGLVCMACRRCPAGCTTHLALASRMLYLQA